MYEFDVDISMTIITKIFSNIISIENREDIASIRTIGEVIWSPDSSKLLIGVENHQNESIDLAIYYINSQIVEPLIEADKYTDYLPKYWDESNHIGYVKINDDKEEEHSYKYDLSKEEELMNIILSGEEKHVSRAIVLLPELD